MPAASKHLSQEEILLSVKKGDPAAFSLLFDTYSPVIFAIICKRLGNSKDAEEVLQRIFIKIWQNISAFDPSKQRFLAWTLVISKNVIDQASQDQNLNKNSEIQTTVNNVSNNNEALNLV